MSTSAAQAVKELREITGMGMMECKKILEEAGGDLEKAKKICEERGKDKVQKLAGRAATEGIIETYLHFNNKVGVLLELNCNTDFVARNEAFRQLAKDLAMHIAAMKPACVNREQLDQTLVDSVKKHLASEVPPGKPQAVVDKIVEGKMKTWYADRVLLDQPFARDGSKTISQLIEEVISKTKENVTVARFVRFQVGETSAASEVE